MLEAELPPVRLMIVDDNPRVRAGMVALARAWIGAGRGWADDADDEAPVRRWEVVATLGRGDAITRSILRDRPDVVLLDLDMAGRNALRTLTTLRCCNAAARVVAYAAAADAMTVRAVLAAGAHGLLLKNDDLRDLAEAVRQVMAGRRFLSTNLGMLGFGGAEAPAVLRPAAMTQWPKLRLARWAAGVGSHTERRRVVGFAPVYAVDGGFELATGTTIRCRFPVCAEEWLGTLMARGLYRRWEAVTGPDGRPAVYRGARVFRVQPRAARPGRRADGAGAELVAVWEAAA